MNNMEFDGFPKEMLPFLHENRMRNSKEWYSAHRDEYKKYVYEPFASFVRELAPAMTQIDPLIVTQPFFCLCHIYRDTRFTKDKASLYRENMWVTFKRPVKSYPYSPAFYFEITRESVHWGMGYWAPTASVMGLYRRYILDYPDRFREKIGTLSSMYASAEHYKKKFAEMPEDDLRDWFLYKNIHVTGGTEVSDIYDGGIAERVRRELKEAEGLYKLVYEIKDMPELVSDKSEDIPINKVKDFEW